MDFSAQFPPKKGPGNLTPNKSVRKQIQTVERKGLYFLISSEFVCNRPSTEIEELFVLFSYFPDIHLSGVRTRVVSKRVVWRMFPWTKSQNKGAFRCSPVPKPGYRDEGTFGCSHVPKTGREKGHIRQNCLLCNRPFVSSQCFCSILLRLFSTFSNPRAERPREFSTDCGREWPRWLL